LDHDDYIRDLCAKAAAATDEEAIAILAELRRALHEHITQIRQTIRAAYPRESSKPFRV
jgi:hypothetical protein